MAVLATDPAANPSGGATAAFPTTGTQNPFVLAAQQNLDAQRYHTDAATAQGRLTQQYQVGAPKLKSSIAAAGQFYGSARQDAETNAFNDYSNGSADIQSGMQRNLQNLDAQRMYATLGLVI